MTRHGCVGFCLASLLFAGVSPVEAETEIYRLRYDASLLGLHIGQADFTSRIEDGAFDVSGRFASAGLARLFDRTDGIVSSQGALNGGAVVPALYALDYKSGRKRETTSIRFARGKIVETVVLPKPKKRGKDWVSVSESDLVGAMDPLSALLSPALDADQVCKRRFKVFDGEMRADIQFSPAGEREQISKDTITCKARFVPVSGYRKGRSTIDFLRDRARILVAFKPLGSKGHHTPVAARIGTKIGTVHIRSQPLK